MRLNLGCGRDIKQGWINIDSMPLPGVDLVCDLDAVKEKPIDLPDSSVDLFLLSHIIEHIKNPLDLMQELWRLAKPEAVAVIKCPYGSSNDAWEDPTHIRPYYEGSFGYFSQPYYWRADYGYRGDWQPDKIILFVDGNICNGLTPDQIRWKVNHQPNVVKEMYAELKAIQPIREPKKELQTNPEIEIKLVG